AIEMKSKLRHQMRRTRAIVLYQLFTSLPVKHHPAFGYQVAIKKILIKRMREAIAGRQTSVRQLLFATHFDQAMGPLQVSQPFFQIDFVDTEQTRNHV